MAGCQQVERGEPIAICSLQRWRARGGRFWKGSLRGFAAVRKGPFAGFETSERVTWVVSSERKGSLGGFSAGGSVRFGAESEV